MKYILTLTILLIACSNPVDVPVPDLTEYAIQYHITGEGLIESAHYFNPEAELIEEWDYTAACSPLMTAAEGAYLWLIAEGTGAFHAQIWVDGVLVVESAGGVPGVVFYAEWLLQ